MRILAAAAALAFVIDQVTKYWIVHAMGLATRRAIDVLPPVLNLRYGENRGINFGLFDGHGEASRWILIGIAAVVCAAVLWWVRRERPGPWGLAAAGLLFGGALGNVLDRLIYGYVLDFLNMSCCGIDNPFVFNLADVFIFLGALGLIFLPPRAGDGKNDP